MKAVPQRRDIPEPGEGYVSLLGSILLGVSGHFVKPCETAPMGQGSLLAVLAYGELTFRLRYAYGRVSYFFGFYKSRQFYNEVQQVKLGSKMISHDLKIHLPWAFKSPFSKGCCEKPWEV